MRTLLKSVRGKKYLMVDHEEKVSNYSERQTKLESPGLRVIFQQHSATFLSVAERETLKWEKQYEDTK